MAPDVSLLKTITGPSGFLRFHRIVVSARGHCVEKDMYNTARFEPRALQFLTTLIDRPSGSFRTEFELRHVGPIAFKWTWEDSTCASATFSTTAGILATDVLVSGLDAVADLRALKAAQALIEKVCTQAGETVNDELLHIEERPALASIRWQTPNWKVKDAVGDLEICLAGAFFQRVMQTWELLAEEVRRKEEVQ